MRTDAQNGGTRVVVGKIPQVAQTNTAAKRTEHEHKVYPVGFLFPVSYTNQLNFAVAPS